MTRNRTLALVLAAFLALGAGAYVAYDQVLRGDDLARLALPSASASPGATAASADPGSATPSEAAATGASQAAGSGGDGAVAGDWTIADGQAGYRVRERLANLPAESDAVGRTGDVTGTITVIENGDSVQLTEGAITVDTTTIASDESRRDNRMRDQGLQTDAFPTATFTLTEPVEIPASALQGTAAELVLVGDLTLHGVTKSVSIPTTAQVAGGQIQVAGAVTFPLSDFDIVAPNVGGFIISIADEGTLEFSLAFDKS